MRREHGLTLIELLIAMSLMALLAILGYRAFASLLISRERLISTGSEWNNLARAFSRVERDIANLSPGEGAKTISLQQGRLVLALPSARSAEGWEWRQYQPTASGIAWGWSTASSPASINSYPLLEAATPQWSVGLGDGSWHESWPDGHGNPVALKLTVKLSDGQKVERIWALP